MGQALKFCTSCENKRGCDLCADLHNWIMEHLEAEPVRYGHWIPVTRTVIYYFDPMNEVHYKCSLCNGESESKGKYCPNCGAKMEGEKNE